MKVIEPYVVLDRGGVIDSVEWSKIHATYTDAIRAMVYPAATRFSHEAEKRRRLTEG
jgi:hypothetical protein